MPVDSLTESKCFLASLVQKYCWLRPKPLIAVSLTNTLRHHYSSKSDNAFMAPVGLQHQQYPVLHFIFISTLSTQATYLLMLDSIIRCDPLFNMVLRDCVLLSKISHHKKLFLHYHMYCYKAIEVLCELYSLPSTFGSNRTFVLVQARLEIFC